MRALLFLVGLLLQFFCFAVFASTPEIELRQMIERDMVGDPVGRLHMAAPNASVAVGSNRQPDKSRIAYELDADAVEIATEWRIEKSARCSKNRCVLGVVYRVVATTKGSGVPSWDRPQGREIWPLVKPVERLVKYQIVRVGSDWRIFNFPIPYVAPKAMKEFFAAEIERAESIVAPADQDQRAIRNREVIRVWRKRQLDALNKLSL